MDETADLVKTVCKELFGVDVEPVLTRPEEKFGDYATNIALQLAKQLGKNPREVATEIAGHLSGDKIVAVDVAGPGFINLRLSDAALTAQASSAASTKPRTYAGKEVVAEYSDPNAFKQLHVGHLYTTLVGDTIARLCEVAGASVHRVNFGGDVGLHVAKNMWAITKYLGGKNPSGLEKVNPDPHERAAWMNAQYIVGNNAYETDVAAKQEIIAINKRVYDVHAQRDHESAFAQIYWTCRQWSYDYFAVLYDDLQVAPFERYYPESETAAMGVATVREHIRPGMYEESDGAVVFKGEPYGLHTRVFINSNGLPTYEAKDVGLILKKWQDYQFDLSLIITGGDIIEYMKVVLKSIEQFEPELAKRSRHLTHGNIKLKGGVKMSSRLGNGILALEVLEAAKDANKKATGKDDPNTVLGAIKYAFLKQRIGVDTIYDPEESVSLQGNSGPYLMYAHARARSILAKAAVTEGAVTDLEPAERALARKICEYPEVVERAVDELMPHHICTYLYELAQVFNRFYEKNRVIGDEREGVRLRLVSWYADVLKNGLNLLGITAPDKM
jgi:arginyl-tRNA synthetase